MFEPLSNETIADAIRIIRRAVRGLPDPAVTMVGKKWKSPYLVLVACLLSLRTKDETTLPAAERLFRLADTPQDMAGVSVADIEKEIYPVGFYKTKARRIVDIAKDIVTRFSGRVPDTMEGLRSLKGVGPKTANLVLVEGFGKYGVCVDTHVHRISNRLGYTLTETPAATEAALRLRLPRKFWKEYNALLVVWGQNICRPVSPRCSVCPLAGWCRRVGVRQSR